VFHIKETQQYLLNSEDILEIEDLLEGITIAISKIINYRKVLVDCPDELPAVRGLRAMIDDTMKSRPSNLDDIF
jgi:hypothetical protein